MGERLKRIGNVLGGRADALLDRVETPDDVVRRIRNEARGDRIEIERRTQDVIRQRENLRAKTAELARMAASSYAAAESYVQAGNIEAGRAAFERHSEALAFKEDLESDIERLTQIAEQLKRQIVVARRNEERVRTEATVAAARLQSARAMEASARTVYGDPKRKGPSAPELLRSMGEHATDALSSATAIAEIGQVREELEGGGSSQTPNVADAFAALVTRVQASRAIEPGKDNADPVSDESARDGGEVAPSEVRQSE